jgi:spore coat protein CotH
MMAKSASWLARTLTVVLAISLGLFAPTQANAISLTQADIFNPARVNKIELSIPDASADSLNSSRTAKNYVEATFKFTSNGLSIGPIDVGIRLKGSTSLERLSGRPSFKVAFNWKLLKGNRFLGLKNLTLNAMTQDGSKLHEFGSYKLFNLMGVPAPRTGWTELRTNGTSRGLYLSLESVDDIFLNSKFRDVTQHLYEGVALNDLKPGKANGGENDGGYLVKEGWAARQNKDDLQKLINAANYSSGSAWWTKLGTVMDRTALLKMLAVENFIGHWDGYSGPLQNNHFLRSNILGKFTMLPWGADQTFGENRATATLLDDYFVPLDKPTAGFPWVQQAFKKDTMPRGLLFTKCLAYKTCKVEYLKQLKAVSAKVTSAKFVASMKSAATTISTYSAADVKAEQVRVQSWIVKQQSRVTAVLKTNGIR